MKVRDRWDDLEAVDGAALFVAHDEPQALRDVLLGDELDAAGLPFPVLVDRSREAYARWGCGRIAWWRLWLDPNVWKQYWSLLRRGMSIRGAGGDTLQLGGDFIVAPDGSLAYSRPQQRDDRPAVGELIDRMHEVAAPARN